MSLPYIRKTYGVPAFRGQRVKYVYDKGPNGEQLKDSKFGTIKSAAGAYLRIKWDGDLKTYPANYHPTWNLEYLTK